MKTTIRVSALALLLGGCVANQITFDRAQFAIAYADLKATAAVRIYQVRMACQQQQFDANTCRDFEASITELLRVENEIRRSLMNPEQQVDWQRVIDLTTVILGLAMKVAL